MYAYLKKWNKNTSNKQLNCTSKETKKGKIKSKVSRRNEIINIWGQVNEIYILKMQKIKETKSLFNKG